MHLSNSRPLLDQVSPASGLGGSMRRNASGILAGETMHFNNRLRENWLQQTYNEQDLRSSAPQALMQDFNSRVHGEPRDYQIDHQGQFSRYNDAYRDRMLDGLDNLKTSYNQYGGNNASFTNQVRDLENYMHFNRPPPLNPLLGSVPYSVNGPATTFARQGALPPPVTIGYPYPGFNGMYPPPNFIDHDRKMLRTHLVSQKQTINELQEELHGVRREGQRFEDILHKGHQDIHRLNNNHFPGVYTSSNIDTMDPRKGTVKWGDAETDKTLHGLAVKEQELIRTLSKLPENTDLFKTKRAKLDELVRQRTEIERMLYSKADYKNYLHEKVVDDSKKDNLAQWLRRDLELFKIDKNDDDFIERRFRPSQGFLVYWDYILNLAKEFRQIQIVYGIYNRGMTMFEPRLVPLTDTIDTTHPSFCQAIFALNHLVRDIEAHPDLLLILEVQVPAHRNTRPAKKSNMTEQSVHTGYLLSRFGKIGGNGQYEYGDPENPNGIDEQIDTGVFQTYGWTVLDLFNFKNDLKRGTYKLPIYKPPTIINLDTRDIPQLERIKDSMIWMRVAYPKDDEINEVRCEPAYYHIYYVPEVHNIAPKVTMHLKPERDPMYSCDGIQMYIHWCKGYTHSRFVRVACAMQVGKDVLLEDNGRLCFYTSKGLYYPKPKSRLAGSMGTAMSNKVATAMNTANNAKLGTASPSQQKPEKPVTAAQIFHNDAEKTIYFNEQRTWYKDLYNMLWDVDLKENVYLILQYIELKPEVENPTGHTVITRQLIEDEYDMIGYTVLMLNNPDGTLRYGSYILDLYDGPVYVEELDALKRNECSIKITIAKPGEFVPYNEEPSAALRKTPKTAQSVVDDGDNSQVGTPAAKNNPGTATTPKSRDDRGGSKSRGGSRRRRDDEDREPRRRTRDDPEKPRSNRKTPSRDRDAQDKDRKLQPRSRQSRDKNEPKSPAERNYRGKSRDREPVKEESKRPKSGKKKKKKKKKKNPQSRGKSAQSDYSYGDEDDYYDIFDKTQAANDKLGKSLDPARRKREQYFIQNDVPQNTGQPFPQNQGIDFYVDAARFLPDNVTVSKIQIAAYTTEHQQISVSAGGLADLDLSTTFQHYYGFRYEFRLPKFHPQTLVVITIYTIDRTSNQVRTLGFSCFHMFLNRITLLPCDNPKDRDFVLREGLYQLPIFIEDPRKLPEIRSEALDYLERLPCSSLLVRILRAPQAPNGSVLSAKTVPQNQWVDRGVVVPAPDYTQGLYNTSLCPVSDVELELFPSRAERVELPLKDTAEQLMQALSAQRSRNSNTLLDWLDQRLSVENDDAPMLDLKYFATYDPEFGLKVAVDGIHNLPKRQNVFYVVVMSLNPPSSLYTDSKIPTSDVNLISTYDWESSIISCRFLDNYFYYQDVKPDAQMSVVYDVREIEFVNGIPKVQTVAWTSIPIFFMRYGNYYVRSGAFQVPLFKGPVEYSHLANMYNFDDPWNYLAQRLNERSIQLWEGVSLIVRLLDSQREGHYSRPFDFDRFNMVYIPESVQQKLNYAYTGATEARLRTTPRLLSMVPPNLDKMVFQEAVNRTFNNLLGLSSFR